VEQTGYPPEVVELDADLEADLGIDSIKKAQMFGELQEYFDVTTTDNLTLDDFPTLRHIVNFLASVPQKGTAAPVAEAAPAPSPAPVVAKPQPAAMPEAQTKPQAVEPQPAVAPFTSSGTWEICRFGAPDAAALKALVEKSLSDSNAWEASRRRKFSPSETMRL